ncbi:hypothetical protein V1512DRAFT_268688 [Lipomyces arxii]|uniref:uncharacterized protein n=1 Tax=Lipomyces arxii TaxID=56418 RepID=UPI0034CF86FD
MASQSSHSLSQGTPSSSVTAKSLQRPQTQNGSQNQIPPQMPAQYGLEPLPPAVGATMLGMSEFQAPASSRSFLPPPANAATDSPMTGRMITPHMHFAPGSIPETNGSVPAMRQTLSSGGYTGESVFNGRNGGRISFAASPYPTSSINGAQASADSRELETPQLLPGRNGNDARSDIVSAMSSLSVKSATPSSQPASEDSSTVTQQDIGFYIYNAGFVHAAWADTFLSIPPHTTLRLHALIIARSPLLYQYLTSFSAQGPPYTIHINNTDPNLSMATISMALATLYGHPLLLESPTIEVAKGLIAAGNFFVLDEVALVGYNALVSLITLENFTELLSFALEGSTEVVKKENIDLSFRGPYPKYTGNLLSSLITYLIENLEHGFILHPSSKPELRELLVTMPFHLFKHICETEDLGCKSQMERYGFARDITGERERRRRQSGGGVFEEGVVIAFGGGKDGVEVIRKPVGKKKVLWKALQ